MQHNPNVVACHCEGQGWSFSADCNMRIRFWGPSMQLEPLGVLSVAFDDGETYEWSKVRPLGCCFTSCSLVLLPRLLKACA